MTKFGETIMADVAGKSNENSWREAAKTVAQALALAMIVQIFFYQPFNIPSGSMKSTLLVGDYLFVSKLSYGYSRYTFPWGIIPFDLSAGHRPQHGFYQATPICTTKPPRSKTAEHG